MQGRVLLSRSGIVIANLRFSAHAFIDEHSAPFEIDVVCVDGEGYVSVDGVSSPLHCGESVTWPASVDHRLWTDSSEMETLMIEHRDA